MNIEKELLYINEEIKILHNKKSNLIICSNIPTLEKLRLLHSENIYNEHVSINELMSDIVSDFKYKLTKLYKKCNNIKIECPFIIDEFSDIDDSTYYLNIPIYKFLKEFLDYHEDKGDVILISKHSADKYLMTSDDIIDYVYKFTIAKKARFIY